MINDLYITFVYSINIFEFFSFSSAFVYNVQKNYIHPHSISIINELNDTTQVKNMVFIIDGCSFHYAHTWCKSGFSICSKHLVTSKESLTSIYFFVSKKDLVYIMRAQRKMTNHLI